jgi:hypothetical protein
VKEKINKQIIKKKTTSVTVFFFFLKVKKQKIKNQNFTGINLPVKFFDFWRKNHTKIKKL